MTRHGRCSALSGRPMGRSVTGDEGISLQKQWWSVSCLGRPRGKRHATVDPGRVVAARYMDIGPLSHVLCLVRRPYRFLSQSVPPAGLTLYFFYLPPSFRQSGRRGGARAFLVCPSTGCWGPATGSSERDLPGGRVRCTPIPVYKGGCRTNNGQRCCCCPSARQIPEGRGLDTLSVIGIQSVRNSYGTTSRTGVWCVLPRGEREK
jgi:hypothetical protein